MSARSINFSASGDADAVNAKLAESGLGDLIAPLSKEVAERGQGNTVSVAATLHDNPDGFSLSVVLTLAAAK